MAEGPDWASGKPVEVDVDSLHAFGSLVQAELDQNVKPGANKVLNHLTGGPDAAPERTFGVDSRYQQGVMIGNYHNECETRARKLLEDFQVGMAAIAAAAQSIAQDYGSTDHLNHMEMNKVDGYFHPSDKSRSLAEQLGLPPDNVPDDDATPHGPGGRVLMS